MNTQHTPGPWRFEKATKTIRSVPANYWLASMNSWDGAVNHEANARLIAAAPDLLAALLITEDFIVGFEDDESQEGIAEMLAKIRAAITKVEKS